MAAVLIRASRSSTGEQIGSMPRHAFFAMAVAVLLFAADVRANDPVRIDASSDAAAKASFARMIESLPKSERRELRIAILGSEHGWRFQRLRQMLFSRAKKTAARRPPFVGRIVAVQRTTNTTAVRGGRVKRPLADS